MMKINSIRQQREDARQAAWYARAGFRRRLVEQEQTLSLESKDDRWRREAEEREQDEAVTRRREKINRAAELTEQRRHELNVARSWGAAVEANSVMDADTLIAISDALNALVERIEALEAHVGINGDKLTTEAVELPRFLSPKYGTSLGWPEDVRFSQPLMTKQNAK